MSKQQSSKSQPQPSYPAPDVLPVVTVSLLPPWWSILLTLMLVVLCAGTVVLLVLALGGNAAPPEAPRLVVLTAASVGNFVPESSILTDEVPTLPAAPGDAQNPISFVMAGPTLPPPPITPTAISISVGVTIRVVDVGDQQLNVRERPGVQDVAVKFRAPENSLFTVINGPNQADGLTWWEIQDPENTRHTGWAASNYLEVVPTETP